MILSVSESGSVPEIWDLSVGRTDTVSVRYVYWHCVSVSVQYLVYISRLVNLV